MCAQESPPFSGLPASLMTGNGESNDLQRLSEIQSFLESYESAKETDKSNLEKLQQELIDSILTPEILAKVQEIKAEFAPKFSLLENDENYLKLKSDAEALTDEIKAEVIEVGETIKGSCLMAVYAKGRVSWDTKALDGYCVAHPEVEQFRKVGEPSVSIRKIS